MYSTVPGTRYCTVPGTGITGYCVCHGILRYGKIYEYSLSLLFVYALFGIVGEDGTMTFSTHIRDSWAWDLSLSWAWGHLGHIIHYSLFGTRSSGRVAGRVPLRYRVRACHGILRYGKIYEYSLF